MLQIIVMLVSFLVLIVPVGWYLAKIVLQEKSFGERFFAPLEKVIFKVSGINVTREMSWKQYFFGILLLNGVMMLVAYLVLRIQGSLFLNPAKIGNFDPTLTFNTVISFMTNTNLQHYAGESAVSYGSQMMVMTFMMFTSAATGFAAASAFMRGISGRFTHFGNFYVDVVRVIVRVLLPLALVVGLLLVWQGVPQTLNGTQTITTLEGNLQDIALGPVASLESIKHLGTNGGGFFGANSSSPFENPTVLTNIIEMLSMMLLPGALLVAFGIIVTGRLKEGSSHSKRRHFLHSEAKPLFTVMAVLFLVGLSVILITEKNGNPLLAEAGISQAMGSLEGKEVRFGVTQSSLFSEVTTAFTTGSVNNMHETLMPLSGGVTLMNMMLNVVFGGKGAGMMNMVLYVLLAVFMCGLMIGRTPEYLGKKIEGKEMKLVALGIIFHPLLILSFSALALSTSQGLAGITQPGQHGLSQVLYEFTSAAANNGSGFEGLLDKTPFWNITTGIVMFGGRYLSLAILLAIASSMMKKPFVSESFGTLKTNTTTFTVALLMVVLLIAALTFVPVLILGPIVEHLSL